MGDYLNLIDDALQPVPTRMRQIASSPVRVDAKFTLKPVAECESWNELVFLMPSIKWSPRQALATLGVEQVEFTSSNPRQLGYTQGWQIAISPSTLIPLTVLLHELAHVILGHTFAHAGSDRSTALQEVQAETVAWCVQILIGASRLQDHAISRTYIADAAAQLKTPLTHSDIAQINVAIGELFAAGR